MMEEIPASSAPKATKNEKAFLDGLANFTTKFSIPKERAEKLTEALKRLHNNVYAQGENSFLKSSTQLTIRTIGEIHEKSSHYTHKGEICLAHVFVDLIHETQMLMAYLSPEAGLQLAQKRIPFILEQLKIYYRYFYDAEPREEFLNELDKIIYHAICRNYQKDIVLARDRIFLLQKAYRGRSELKFKMHLRQRYECYSDVIDALDFLTFEDRRNAFVTLTAHHTEIQNEFLRHTRQKTNSIKAFMAKVQYRAVGIILFFLATYSFAQGWVIPALALGLCGSVGVFFPVDQVLEREFTPEDEETYKKTAAEHLTTLLTTEAFKEEAKLLRTQFRHTKENLRVEIARKQKRGVEKMTANENRLSYEEFHTLLDIHDLFWRHSFGLRGTNASAAQTIKSEAAEHVDNTRVVIYSFPEYLLHHNPASDPYDVTALNRHYRKPRDRVAMPENNALTSSTLKTYEVLYKLPPETQHSACFVVEGRSKMIFDLSIHIGELSAENRQKFLTGQYHVVAKRGKFGGFKHLKSGEYELKLPSSNVTENKHLRFFFEQNGHKEVESNNGATHKVPYYRATGTGGK